MGKELGQYIRGIRKEKKMSVKELHEDSSVSKSYIDYIESGLREPLPEMLAKIAVVLGVPLSTLLEIQKKEQLATAINKLRADNASLNEGELRAVARTANNGLTVDEQALAQTQEAFRDSDNAKLIACFIVNPDLRAIVKAGAELSGDDLLKLRKIMESVYPDAFNK
jgi:transcriptional regulator with XRE-family HTH domain